MAGGDTSDLEKALSKLSVKGVFSFSLFLSLIVLSFLSFSFSLSLTGKKQVAVRSCKCGTGKATDKICKACVCIKDGQLCDSRCGCWQQTFSTVKGTFLRCQNADAEALAEAVAEEKKKVCSAVFFSLYNSSLLVVCCIFCVRFYCLTVCFLVAHRHCITGQAGLILI